MRFIDILPYAIGAISTGGAFIFGRRGRIKNVDSIEIANLKEIIDIQQKRIEFFGEEMEKMRGEVSELNKRLTESMERERICKDCPLHQVKVSKP